MHIAKKKQTLVFLSEYFSCSHEEDHERTKTEQDNNIIVRASWIGKALHCI